MYGKHEFRLREQHVADHLIPLMRRRCVGAAKLDVLLRGVGLLDQHTGKRREVGLVLPRYEWAQLHDLVRAIAPHGDHGSDTDPSATTLRLKRKWVGEQLARLEEMNLIRRVARPGRRPLLLVLRDDASGEPLDDPDGSEGNRYVRILGGLISSGALARWSVPELSAYLAAMVAERHADAQRGLRRERATPGSGSWDRPLGWFADRDGRYGSRSRLRLPFSVPTLERGMLALEREGLLERRRTVINPRTGRRFQGPRIVYTNRFHTLNAGDETMALDAYLAKIGEQGD